jgi:signal transduction histidine kinase
MKPAPEPRRRLLLRIYLYGILMLVLAAGASLVVGRYVLQPAFEVPTRPSTTWIAWHLAELHERPEELRRQLDQLATRSKIYFSLFDASSKLLATSLHDTPVPLTAEEFGALSKEPVRFSSSEGAVAIHDAAGVITGYVRIRYPDSRVSVPIALAQLGVGLLVLALLSAPLARSIAAPIEQLATRTRAFGKGDLSVRSGVKRSDEIGALGQAFDEMAERITELRRSEKELLANISHELRTPLARIRFALELLANGDREKANSYLRDIDEDLAELEQLLNDVMTTARLELARGSLGEDLAPLRLEPLDSRELLDAAIGRFHKRHRERELHCEVGAELGSIDADPTLLRRVLDNLLDNAEKFSEQETHVVLVAKSRPEDMRLVIDVVDHGIGISDEDLPRIFEPFFRGDRSRTRATGGVGLGLAMARKIVEAHAGSIEVRSTVGRGSRFRVLLPLASRTHTSA